MRPRVDLRAPWREWPRVSLSPRCTQWRRARVNFGRRRGESACACGCAPLCRIVLCSVFVHTLSLDSALHMRSLSSSNLHNSIPFAIADSRS
eukprot:1502464-Prymnesium_polylepis.1